MEFEPGSYIIVCEYQVKKGNEINFTALPLELEKTESGEVRAAIEGSPSLEERLKLCPTEPGIYIMKDGAGHVIYVGKAKNLRSRVRSYFQNSKDLSPKTVHLVSKVEGIEFLQTQSETEALLLENNLIKKWKPKYNIRLKDDKTYPYLKLAMDHPFPRPYIARKQFKGDGNEYFGPFPNSGYLRQVLRGGAKVFQLRDCRDHDFANRSRPCLSYEIGQCTAPCVGYVTKEDYAKQVGEFRDFLSGDSNDLQQKWLEQMDEASNNLEFEKAAQLRDRLEALGTTLSEQAAVSTDEMGDRDIWAVVPESLILARDPTTSSDASEREMFILINQIRGGKWVGSRNSRANIEIGVIDENFFSSLLVQHYSNNPAPEQVIVPPAAQLGSRPDLGLALTKLFQGAAESIDVRFADEKGSWGKYYELARENAQALLDESTAVQSKKDNGLDAIAHMLDLRGLPLHIECVDISNMQGEANVASAVVFKNGKPEKSLYRHYNIRGFEGQDDFRSMREVMSRRYGKTDSPVPELLVIDGGKGQLASAVEILKGLDQHFSVCGLAKARTVSDFQGSEVEASEERVFLPGRKDYIRFKNTEALRIMTHIRDEAHRFAIEFHRLKRGHNRGL